MFTDTCSIIKKISILFKFTKIDDRQTNGRTQQNIFIHFVLIIINIFFQMHENDFHAVK